MRRDVEEFEVDVVVVELKRQLEDETLSLEQKITLLKDGLNSENSNRSKLNMRGNQTASQISWRRLKLSETNVWWNCESGVNPVILCIWQRPWTQQRCTRTTVYWPASSPSCSWAASWVTVSPCSLRIPGSNGETWAPLSRLPSCSGTVHWNSNIWI